MKKDTALPLFLFFLFINILHGQEFSYKHYGVPEGLPQSQVTKLFQDSKGFIWIVTKGGISRFDGIQFTNFSLSEGLLQGHIQDIAETQNGKIWFINEEGLTCWDGENMKSYPKKIKSQSDGFVYLIPGSNDNLIILHLEKNCIRKIEFLNGSFDEKNPFRDPQIKFLGRDRYYTETNNIQDGSIWFTSSNHNLHRFHNDTLITIPCKFSNAVSVTNRATRDAYFFLDHSCFKIIDNTLKLIFKEKKINYDHSYREIGEEGTVDQNGVIYFQDSCGRLSVYDQGNLLRDHYQFPIITCMFIDRENNLWIGTESGVFRLLSRAFLNFIPEKCSIHPSVWSIAEDRKRNIWFASCTKGLQVFDGNTFVDETGYRKLKNIDHDDFYMGSLVDRNGDILFTTTIIGGIRYDGQRFSTIFSKNPPSTNFCFYEDPKTGDLFAGTTAGLIIRHEDGTQNVFGIRPGEKGNKNIISIVKDKNGYYWTGNFKGISLFKDGIAVPLPTKEIPFSKGGNALITDKKENLWIGNNEGLFFYNYSQIQQILLPEKETFITALALVGDTALLIGSVKGLDWMDLKTYYATGHIVIRNFGNENGFQGIEVGQNGFFRDSTGYYWIPCSDRVVRFDPRCVQMRDDPVRIYLSKISALNEKMEWVMVKRGKQLNAEIRLLHDQKNLRFDFLGINTSSPEKIQYSCMLEGYETGWSQPDDNRYVIFTNLSPGEYTLKVKARIKYEAWSAQPSAFQFQILPAFWQTWWFRILIPLLMAIGFVYLGFYLTDRRRKAQQVILETEKRMAELQLISVKNQIDPHFTFNAVNSIASVILKENKEQAYHFFVKLSSLIRTVLTSSDKLTRTLQEEVTFITNYVEIEKFRFKEKFNYSILIGESVNMEQEVPKMILQTYVENAIKHGLMHKEGTGLLQISINQFEKILVMIIEDNGIGREKAKELTMRSTGKGLMIMNYYFDFFNKYNDEKITQEALDLFDQNENASGTRITINIPVGYSYQQLFVSTQTKRPHGNSPQDKNDHH